MTRFWLIRHGEPVEEARGCCYGSLDFKLSTAGRDQMGQDAQYLTAEHIAVVYTSPLSRALESARIIADAQSCPVEVLADLREIDFGEFEGMPYDEIAIRYPHLYRQWMETPTEVRFPNGESFPEMRTRTLRAFDAIQTERSGQTVAVVSHGGVNRILIAWALQMPDNSVFRLAQDYAAVNLLVLDDGLPRIDLVNHRCAFRKPT